jgi:hypothetical protein
VTTIDQTSRHTQRCAVVSIVAVEIAQPHLPKKPAAQEPPPVPLDGLASSSRLCTATARQHILTAWLMLAHTAVLSTPAPLIQPPCSPAAMQHCSVRAAGKHPRCITAREQQSSTTSGGITSAQFGPSIRDTTPPAAPFTGGGHISTHLAKNNRPAVLYSASRLDGGGPMLTPLAPPAAAHRAQHRPAQLHSRRCLRCSAQHSSAHRRLEAAADTSAPHAAGRAQHSERPCCRQLL